MKCTIPTFNYSIKNSSGDSVDIHIDGDIVDAQTQAIWKEWFGDDTSTSFKSFRDQLNAVEATTYNVYINSGGGIVTDAMAIHDLLIDIQAKGKTVNTIGRGIIASAATYILMAGKNCRMSKNSWFMIHNVGGGVWGDVNMVENYAATLRKFNNRSRDFYSEATGIRKEDITKMMNDETWMTADEAKLKGFIKQIENEAAFTNLIPNDKWAFANMAVLNAYNSAVKVPPVNTPDSSTQLIEMKKFLQDLKTEILNAFKGIKQPENNDHATLMNSIGEAVGNAFENATINIDKTVTDAVTTALASKEVNDAIALQVSNAVKAGIDFSKDGDAKTALTNAVKTVVDEAVKFDADGPAKTALTSAVSTAVTAAVKTEVDASTKDLKTDITNLKGGKTTPENTGKDEPTPVGGFS